MSFLSALFGSPVFHFAATTFKIFFTSLRSHGLSLPSTTAFIDAVVRGKESLGRSHMLRSALYCQV